MIFETIHNQVFIETKLAKIEIFPNYENEDFSGKFFFFVENYSKILRVTKQRKMFQTRNFNARNIIHKFSINTVSE